MTRRVLVVDDNQVNRHVLRKILSNDYWVLEAENGQIALSILRENAETISAVLLDIVMPVMDGYTVLTQMRADPNMANIPVIVTAGNTDADADVEAQALAIGANDVVIKPYNPAVIQHRLWNTINLRETAALANAATLDALTGLCNRAAFFARAEEMITARAPGFYVLACFDINNFKVINDQYGTYRGDDVLRHTARVFREGFAPVGGLCCRMMADNFAVLYPASFMNTEKIAEIRRKASDLDGVVLPITFSIGRYIVEDTSLSVSAMYDRAAIAKDSVKGRYDVHIAQYDASMRERIIREQEIVNEMTGALATGQFEPWL